MIFGQRFRVFLVCMAIVAIVWSIGLFVMIRDEQLSPLSQQWQQSTAVGNEAYYFLAGFNAPLAADPVAYGQQKWRFYLEGAADPLSLAKPSSWQFSLPCSFAMVECLRDLQKQQAGLSKRLSHDAFWLERLRTFLASDAPKAPLERPQDSFGSITPQLTAAFELQLGDYLHRLEQTDVDRLRDVFSEINQHMGHLIRHLNETSSDEYQRLLSYQLKTELAWLVAQLQYKPELKSIAVEQLTFMSSRQHLAVTLQPVLAREFANSSHAFQRIGEKGISKALEWDLSVSSLFQAATWQPNRTMNLLASYYQHALELSAGFHGFRAWVDASEKWPRTEALWRDNNLLGALLLSEQLTHLSHLLKSNLLAEAYYAVVRSWLFHDESHEQLPESIQLLGHQVDLQQRALEGRLCVMVPPLNSLDDYCIRLIDYKLQ